MIVRACFTFNHACCSYFYQRRFDATTGQAVVRQSLRFKCEGCGKRGHAEPVLEGRMDNKAEIYYRVFTPGVPNVRVISERLTEAEAHRRKREILMAYPAATVRIEKMDESGRANEASARASHLQILRKLQDYLAALSRRSCSDTTSPYSPTAKSRSSLASSGDVAQLRKFSDATCN